MDTSDEIQSVINKGIEGAHPSNEPDEATKKNIETNKKNIKKAKSAGIRADEIDEKYREHLVEDVKFWRAKSENLDSEIKKHLPELATLRKASDDAKYINKLHIIFNAIGSLLLSVCGFITNIPLFYTLLTSGIVLNSISVMYYFAPSNFWSNKE